MEGSYHAVVGSIMASILALPFVLICQAASGTEAVAHPAVITVYVTLVSFVVIYLQLHRAIEKIGLLSFISIST